MRAEDGATDQRQPPRFPSPPPTQSGFGEVFGNGLRASVYNMPPAHNTATPGPPLNFGGAQAGANAPGAFGPASGALVAAGGGSYGGVQHHLAGTQPSLQARPQAPSAAFGVGRGAGRSCMREEEVLNVLAHADKHRSSGVSLDILMTASMKLITGRRWACSTATCPAQRRQRTAQAPPSAATAAAAPRGDAAAAAAVTLLRPAAPTRRSAASAPSCRRC